MIKLTIDGQECAVGESATLLAAAAAQGIYIPTLCSHPDLPPFRDLARVARIFRGVTAHTDESLGETGAEPLESCGLCVVEVVGQPEPVRACQTPVAAGLSIRTGGPALAELRRTRLMRILSHHPHACLTCAQREGCSLENCSSNVPREERCCIKFHNCELRKVAEYVGIAPQTPRYRPAGLAEQRDEPLFTRNFNLCIECARCVRVCNQVRGVEALGFVHSGGRLVVGSLAPTLIESGCKFCGACVEVCPTGCLLDKHPLEGRREQALVPCVHTCPAGVDVPGYIRRIAAGDFAGAAALVWETLPLPNVLGHVCFHLCEQECRRSQLDDPLAICALKRFALEAGGGDFFQDMAIPHASGKKVAVVGAGPAGLAAAYFLQLKGHAVTVFEAASAPGGMPALSIPSYRLPQTVLDKDLAVIGKLGVEMKTGARLDTGAEMVALLRQGYDALLIAVGLPEPRKIAVAGSNLPGVFWGLEFLRAVKSGQPQDLEGREIIVVGGGNVALDVAMTARRLSDRSVRLFCLESRTEMPAHPQEVARAVAEGVEVNPSWGPAAILDANGKVGGVRFRRCVSVFDGRRNFAPVFDDTEMVTATADVVILAVGQAASCDLPADAEGVFRAGDIAGANLSVVHAVASGRTAAERIDRHLGGDGDVSVRLAEHKPPDTRIGREAGFAPRPRVAPPCAAATERCTNFRELETTYASEAAVAEARRCLQCDLRLLISPPILPPERWLDFTRANVECVPLVAGVVILADASRKPMQIKGLDSIRAHLTAQLEAGAGARFFLWEEDRMYTKRESELIQQHLQRYGELPGGGADELDELF
jgi:NADPH-dependent glutamate synthase beta subunit-like oxidoreductase